MRPPSGLRSEVELLLHCARAQVEPERAARIAELARRQIDWGFLLGAAKRHRVVSLLYWHPNAICSQAVPESALAEVRGCFQANARHSLLLLGELWRLLDLFEASGIPAIPYKGPVLATVAYDNVALRELIDLDILVHERDVWRARGLLVSLGYIPRVSLTPAQERVYLREGCEDQLSAPSGKYSVEVHWRVWPRLFAIPLDAESLWHRLGSIRVARRTITTLSPEDLLFILCVHGGVNHYWQEIRYACDVAEFLRRRPGPDCRA